MRSTEHQNGEGRLPGARFAGLALAAVIGAASIAAPLAASAEEAAPDTAAAAAAVESLAEPVADATAADASDGASGAAEESGTAGEQETGAEHAEAQAPPVESAGDRPAAEAPEFVDETADADAGAEDAGAKQAPAAFASDEPQGFAPNQAPVAGDDHWQMLQDTALTVSEPGLFANDSDPDGDYFFWSYTVQPSVGALTLTDATSGTFTYTPPAGYIGTVTFEYQVRDDHGADDLDSAFATVTIDVLPAGADADLAPHASDDTYLYTPEVPLYIAAYQGLLANDDLDGKPVTSLSFPYGANAIGNGQVELLGDGGAFLADAGDVPPQTFHLAYRVCNAVGCDDGTLWLYPTDAGVEPSGPDAIPEAPVATADVFGVIQDTMLSIKSPGLLYNDSDSEPGDALEVVVDTDGLSGSVVWAANGGFVYTPPAGFTGTDVFHYRVKDSHGYLSKSVPVELQVGDGSVNHRPIAVDDHYLVQSGETLYIPAPGAMANDVDVDGDALEFSSLQTHGEGDFDQFQGGWMTFTPPAGFIGSTTWTYYVQDEHGLGSLAPAKLTFEVVQSDGEPNHAPVPVVDAYLVEAGQTLTVPAAGVLANDFDADGDTLAVMDSYGAYDGEAHVAVDGALSYTPPAGYTGIDWVEFSVTDGASYASGRAKVVVYEAGAEPAFGNEDAYFPVKDEVFEVDAPGVLANDHVPAGATGEATPLDMKKTDHGMVTLNADGSFVYTPDPGYVGTDTFRYEFHSGETWEYPIVVLTVLEEAPATTEPGDGGEGDGGEGTAGEPGRPSENAGPAEPAADSATTGSSDAGRGSSLAETGSDAAGAAAVSATAVLLGLLGMVGAWRRRRALR
ncbi:Ig-like domain-containing protein [Agromyces soli]